ncbi:hydroxyacid dehydrogenase [Streptomyces sp. NPDC048110]|uniref:hydroxyacid dehydrogenase n=1 Tax=Streptomyces sp. NPDC048110 TaxID=3155483 RepID=UPI0033FFC0D7
MSARLRVAVVLGPTLRNELFGPAEWEELAALVDIVADCHDSQALALHPMRAEIEVLITSWGMPQLTDDFLRELPSLRVIAHAAGSVRKLVSDAVWDRGITVISAADANNEPVAEYVYAQTVLALKDVHRRTHRIKTEAELPPLDHIPGIYRQTVGLISFGSVARKAAALLRRLDTHVVAWDPFVPDDAFSRFQVARATSIDELFSQAQVLSIHTPLIPGQTEQLISEHLIRRLPYGATLINTARGAVVDEEGLIRVLHQRPDLYAVLDVTTLEPLPASSALYTLPNVMLTGHVAGTVGAERRGMGTLVLTELQRISTGAAPQHAVSPRALLLRA